MIFIEIIWYIRLRYIIFYNKIIFTMIKAAVLTALVGLSACNSVMSYSETFPLVNEDYFNLNAYLTGDLAYTTQYKGGAKTSGTATETYGLRMYGFGKFRVQMEFF